MSMNFTIRCRRCQEDVRGQIRFAAHLMKKHERQAYYCDDCPNYYAEHMTMLKDHRRRTHKQIKCTLNGCRFKCGKFQTDVLIRHLFTTHAINLNCDADTGSAQGSNQRPSKSDGASPKAPSSRSSTKSVGASQKAQSSRSSSKSDAVSPMPGPSGDWVPEILIEAQTPQQSALFPNSPRRVQTKDTRVVEATKEMEVEERVARVEEKTKEMEVEVEMEGTETDEETEEAERVVREVEIEEKEEEGKTDGERRVVVGVEVVGSETDGEKRVIVGAGDVGVEAVAELPSITAMDTDFEDLESIIEKDLSETEEGVKVRVKSKTSVDQAPSTSVLAASAPSTSQRVVMKATRPERMPEPETLQTGWFDHAPSLFTDVPPAPQLRAIRKSAIAGQGRRECHVVPVGHVCTKKVERCYFPAPSRRVYEIITYWVPDPECTIYRM
jgi:hypothetical protein